MSRSGRLALLLSLGALASCAAWSSQRPADATLAVTCSDPGAQLYVDERYAGLCGASRELPIPLLTGVHRVEVRCPGRFSAYREVAVARGDHKAIAVALRPDLDADGP